MRNYPANLKAVGGARTGVAPANLLEVEDVNGNVYRWADREIQAPAVILSTVPDTYTVLSTAMPWTWTSSFNSDYEWGKQDGTAPVSIPLLGIESLLIQAQGTVYYTGGSAPSGPLGIARDSLTAAEVIPSQFAGASQSSADFMALVGAWCDSSGNVLGVVFVGASATLLVPAGATFLQLGINDWQFFDNSGSFSVQVTPTPLSNPASSYLPWLLGVPEITYNRSLQTDIGSFQVQNLSGTSLTRDTSAILRKSALEGALFVYRCWQPDAQAAWIEVHGTLTVEDVPPDILRVKGVQAINPAQDDTPLEQYSETCQWNWGLARCGSTQPTECLYSYQSCQVLERIAVVMNNYEKNYGETVANTPLVVINRARKF